MRYARAWVTERECAPVRKFGIARGVALATLLVACDGAQDPPSAPVAVWPPQAGEYCGSAGDVCASDGTPWRCGDRPVWESLECTQQCAAQGGTHEGCRVLTLSDRSAKAALAVPSETVSLQSDAPGVQCLCTPRQDAKCPGPAHQLCASRTEIWACDDTLKWQKRSCQELCQALRPAHEPVACTHDRKGGEDACECTAVGVPCPEEGARTCADSSVWLLCQGGRWMVEVNCDDVVYCPEASAACDFAAQEPGACRCSPY